MMKTVLLQGPARRRLFFLSSSSFDALLSQLEANTQNPQIYPLCSFVASFIKETLSRIIRSVVIANLIVKIVVGQTAYGWWRCPIPARPTTTDHTSHGTAARSEIAFPSVSKIVHTDKHSRAHNNCYVRETCKKPAVAIICHCLSQAFRMSTVQP